MSIWTITEEELSLRRGRRRIIAHRERRDERKHRPGSEGLMLSKSRLKG